MSDGYKVQTGNTIRTFDNSKRNEALAFAGGDANKLIPIFDEAEAYDSVMAAQLSINKGREIAEYMLLELNAKSKEYKQSTGLRIGKSLRESHRNLREALELGDLDEAIVEIQTIVNSGKVDSFLDVYAEALIRIDDFLGVE